MKALKKAEAVPSSEFSDTFVQGMYNRMSVSYFKYGPVSHGFPEKIDAVATLKLCLDAYEKDGNTEHLMDVANYAMIEFMHPRHPKAFFAATDAKGSVGRKKAGTGAIVGKHNDDLT